MRGFVWVHAGSQKSWSTYLNMNIAILNCTVLIVKQCLPVTVSIFYDDCPHSITLRSHPRTAMGPILPQTNVFGKQLGIAPDVMGLITSVLPIMYILAKPTVGYLIDYFASARKVIFMSILLVMTLCYAGFYFVPLGRVHSVPLHDVYTIEMGRVDSCRQLEPPIDAPASLCSDHRPVQCSIECRHAGTPTRQFAGYLSTYRRAFVVNGPRTPVSTTNDTDAFLLGAIAATPEPSAASDDDSTTHYYSSNINFDLCLAEAGVALIGNKSCTVECRPDVDRQPDCVLGTATFWWFVCLMCVGTIGFNVANCVSDATCFDMLGELAGEWDGRCGDDEDEDSDNELGALLGTISQKCKRLEQRQTANKH